VDAVGESETPTLKKLCKKVECGVSGANVTERIVGGKEASPHAWPWQVLLDCEGSCGGSLVSEKWVITAAHCLFYPKSNRKHNINDCTVYLGKHYSSTDNKVEPGQVIRFIESYSVHEQYDNLQPTVGFDIAILKLAKAVQYNNDIKPICFPCKLPELKSTSICYATGWGRDDPKIKKPSKTLKQLQMAIHEDYRSCDFGDDKAGVKICAGSKNRKDDICTGDSGGPLACRESDGKWYLRGVASFVPKEPHCESVAGFTKVTAFKDWITGKIKNN